MNHWAFKSSQANPYLLLFIKKTFFIGLRSKLLQREIKDIERRHLVLGAQLQILLFDAVDALGQVVQRILQFHDLSD